MAVVAVADFMGPGEAQQVRLPHLVIIMVVVVVVDFMGPGVPPLLLLLLLRRLTVGPEVEVITGMEEVLIILLPLLSAKAREVGAVKVQRLLL